jgi:hypothetical protein
MPAIVLRRSDVASLSQAYGDPIFGVPQVCIHDGCLAFNGTLTGSRQTFQRILLASGMLGPHLAPSGHPSALEGENGRQSKAQIKLTHFVDFGA